MAWCELINDIEGRLRNKRLGILLSPIDDGLHIGFVYKRLEQGRDVIHYLHLRFDDDLSNEKWNYRCAYLIEPDIEDERLRGLISLIGRIWRRNGNHLPYGFSSTLNAFNLDGSLRSLRLSGLTCSSFVLAVFQSYSIPLVDLETWIKDRPDDLAFAEKIAQLLADNNRPHQAALIRREAGNGLVRVRPEETAAALHFATPCGYSTLIDTSLNLKLALAAERERLRSGA